MGHIKTIACKHNFPNLSLLCTNLHTLLSNSCYSSNSLILLETSAVLRTEGNYISGHKVSDYFDMRSDISCNVRHFEAQQRDTFSIPEAQKRGKAGKCHFHDLVDCLTAQLLEYRFLLSNAYLDEWKMKIHVTSALSCMVSNLKTAPVLICSRSVCRH